MPLLLNTFGALYKLGQALQLLSVHGTGVNHADLILWDHDTPTAQSLPHVIPCALLKALINIHKFGLAVGFVQLRLRIFRQLGLAVHELVAH